MSQKINLKVQNIHEDIKNRYYSLKPIVNKLLTFRQVLKMSMDAYLQAYK